MLRPDDLPLYAVFALVVRHGSLSEAARRAGLVRSAVSQRIQRLEATLGTELLRRTTRRVVPTDAGLRLYAAAAPLLDAAQAVDPGFDVEGARGVLRVNAPLALVPACLGALLVEFSERHPELELSLSLDNRTVDLLDVQDDVVVRGARRLAPDAVVRRLARDRFVVVAAPGYLARAGTPGSPRELVLHRCLRYRHTPAEEEWRFDGPDGRYVVPVSGPFVVDDGGTLRGLVLAEQGIAVVPSFMVAADVREGRLVELFRGQRSDVLELAAVLPSGRRAPARAKLLVDFLARRMERALERLG